MSYFGKFRHNFVINKSAYFIVFILLVACDGLKKKMLTLLPTAEMSPFRNSINIFDIDLKH